MSSLLIDKLDNVCGKMLSLLRSGVQPTNLIKFGAQPKDPSHIRDAHRECGFVTWNYELGHRPESQEVLYTSVTPTMSLEETARPSINNPGTG